MFINQPEQTNHSIWVSKKCESRTYFTVFKFMRLATRQTMDQSDVETKSQKDSSILGCRAKLPCDVFHHLLMKLSDTMKERRRSRLSLDSGMIVVIFIRWVACHCAEYHLCPSVIFIGMVVVVFISSPLTLNMALRIAVIFKRTILIPQPHVCFKGDKNI